MLDGMCTSHQFCAAGAVSAQRIIGDDVCRMLSNVDAFFCRMLDVAH